VKKFQTCVLSLALLVLTAPLLEANLLDGLLGRKADRVQEKRVEKKTWTGPKASRLQEKKFPIKEWDKHFSPLGSKRAPIRLGDEKEKKRFEVEVLERKTIDFEMSKWNEQIADLHKRAGIDLDDKAQLTADRKLYNMMLQDAPHYRELAQELSVRDLNRFQFRRNRSGEGVPVQKAGSGGE
jgi:hypothetical protein